MLLFPVHPVSSANYSSDFESNKCKKSDRIIRHIFPIGLNGPSICQCTCHSMWVQNLCDFECDALLSVISLDTLATVFIAIAEYRIWKLAFRFCERRMTMARSSKPDCGASTTSMYYTRPSARGEKSTESASLLARYRQQCSNRLAFFHSPASPILSDTWSIATSNISNISPELHQERYCKPAWVAECNTFYLPDSLEIAITGSSRICRLQSALCTTMAA